MNRKGKRRNVYGMIKAGLFIFLGAFAIVKVYQIYADDRQNWDERVEKPLGAMGFIEYTRTLDESPIKEEPDRDYGESGFQIVSENGNYILYADLTTGEICIQEKATDRKWYSNPTGGQESKSSGRIRSQLVLYVTNSSGNISELNSYKDSLLAGKMDYEVLENGVRFSFAFPGAGIVVPVQYSLCSDGLVAEVMTDEIEERWLGTYWLNKVELLPYFGAVDQSEDGYLFVPDGSGALIEFSNNKQRFKKYESNVYGRDLSFDGSEVESEQSVYMPVFGLKCSDGAYVAVVASGEGEGVIYASVSGQGSAYNTIGSGFVFRNISFSSRDSGSVYGASKGVNISDRLPAGENYSVRYMFLDTENADYSGMSQKYRGYLKEQNLLKHSELAGNNYLILDIYGAVTIENEVMGVKVAESIALTGYAEVCSIVKDLKKDGIENIIVNYIGALDGGFEDRLSDKVSYETCLGTKSEFHEMIEYLREENVLLFLETNPVCIYKDGNGYSGTEDGAKRAFGSYAYQYDYTLDTKEAIEEERWYLLTPKRVPKLLSSFSESAALARIQNLSVYGVGDSLYSDMSEGSSLTTRTDCMRQWENALDEMAQHVEYLMVHGGNAYCSQYVDIVADAPVSFSDYDMEDDSIPFYQMTFSNEIVTGSTAVNSSYDYEYMFLKSIENGSSLEFDLIHSASLKLNDSSYSHFNSYTYAQWRDVILELYLRKQEVSRQLKNLEFVRHEQLAEDVALSIYDSRIGVVVNYGEDSYTYQNAVVEGRSYLVMEGVE